MLYAMPPPVMQMPPQPMEESSSSEEEEDDEEDEHDDFLTGATPPSSPRAASTRHVKIRLKIDGASVQENGNELAPLACALTGQRSSGAPLGGNRWGAVGQPSAAPIARQNLATGSGPEQGVLRGSADVVACGDGVPVRKARRARLFERRGGSRRRRRARRWRRGPRTCHARQIGKETPSAGRRPRRHRPTPSHREGFTPSPRPIPAARSKRGRRATRPAPR